MIAQSFSQEFRSEIETLNHHFQSFNYQEVINIADSILSTEKTISDSEKIEIYRLKGVSHFALLQMQSAFKSFINILKIDENYEMDIIQNSPKIVRYFNEIKMTYTEEKIHSLKKEEQFKIALSDQRKELYTSLGYSLILPGLGHLYRNEKTKGLLLTSATIAVLSSSIYFIIDTNHKEKNYLNEVEKQKIEIKYNSYNKSYRYRNISLVLLSAIWIYTQTDLLIFRDTNSHNFSLSPSISSSQDSQLELKIHF